jgi:hypothetical protein
MRKHQVTKHLTAALMLGGLTILVAGCSSDHYYRVTHPTSGNEYYTMKVGDAGKGGAVKIKDEKTGSMVTLQSSDVKEISKKEYQTGMMAKAPTNPAPVQPAAVQPTAAKAAPAQPSAVQPATPQAAPAQPAAVQPAMPQAAPAQPAAVQPAAPQAAPGQP